MVAVRKHLEGKARNLGDDVINARLEAREGFARDVVLEFVEQVADGEFGDGRKLPLGHANHNYTGLCENGKHFRARRVDKCCHNRSRS